MARKTDTPPPSYYGERLLFVVDAERFSIQLDAETRAQVTCTARTTAVPQSAGLVRTGPDRTGPGWRVLSVSAWFTPNIVTQFGNGDGFSSPSGSDQ